MKLKITIDLKNFKNQNYTLTKIFMWHDINYRK